MSVFPEKQDVSCPYCGAKRVVLLGQFEYQNRPVIVPCDDWDRDDQERTCDKYFAVSVTAVSVRLETQLLSGE